MAINTIIFDLGNVVLKFDIRIIAAKIAERFSLDTDWLFDLFFDSELVGLHDDGRIDGAEFHKRAMKMINAEMDFEEFKNIWNNIFTLNEEMAKLVIQCSQKYKIFLMSNTNKMHFDYIKSNFDIIKKFHRVFTSYEVGERKPHPKIFNEGIRASGAKPDEIIFIDDRLDLIEASKKMGIRGIQFHDNIDLLKSELIYNGVEII